jgi:hypothetical protein
MERCALDALLSAGGPVRVSVRPCCLAALVGRRASPAAVPPAETDSEVGSIVCAAAEAELQVTP